MKQLYQRIITISLIVTSIQAFGQAPDSLIQDELPNALLWEVSGKQLSQSSYIYGTIHAIPKDSFFILPEVATSIARADRLVMELQLDMSFLSVFGSLKGMLMPAGTTLSDLLSEEDYSFLTNYMRDSVNQAIPPLIYQSIKPIFLTQLVSGEFCGIEEQQSYELYFQEVFTKAGKPVTGLESINDQMKALDNIPLASQAEDLMAAIRNPHSSCAIYEEMVRAYRQQALSRLMELVQSDEELSGNLDVLLIDRNQKWIPQIESLAQKEVIFVAVGAGHLPGERGVISLLKQAGYTVKPVSN